MLRRCLDQVVEEAIYPESPLLNKTREMPRFWGLEKERWVDGKASAVQQEACPNVSASFSPADLICVPFSLQRYPEPVKDKSSLVPWQEHSRGGSGMAAIGSSGRGKSKPFPTTEKMLQKIHV